MVKDDKYNSNMEKLYFMGNCQVMTYAWYLKRLIPDLDIKWLQSERFLKKLFPGLPIWNDVERVFNLEEVDSILEEGCFLITNNDNKNKSHFKDEYPNTTIKTITSIHENIDGMKERELDWDIDIKLSTIFEDTKANMLTFNHPDTYTFLLAVKQICDFLDAPFFSALSYDKYIKKGFPFELKENN
jgi:hypothetical protein